MCVQKWASLVADVCREQGPDLPPVAWGPVPLGAEHPGYQPNLSSPSLPLGPSRQALTLCVCPIPHRQLLAHFHCLSCDRPLETAVTGQ